MKVFFHITLLLICIQANGQIDCSKYDEDKYIPYDLIDALSYLECKWSESDKESFKTMPEVDAISEIHHGTGMAIRNSWRLWKGNSEIAKYFHGLGIHHPDDMSSIILTSFHRKLNQQELFLDEQIAHYKQYWDRINRQEEQRIEYEFMHYSIGDTVKFNYPFDFISQEQEEHYWDDTCYPMGIVENKNNKEKSLQIRLLISCDINGIIIFEGYIQNGGRSQEREEVRETMKIGEIRWSYYSYWDNPN